VTPTERQYVAALALAYDLAPEYEREEGHLEAAYNRACEVHHLDPGVFLKDARDRFVVQDLLTRTEALNRGFYRGRLGR
jgi:hypothetical protein